MRLEPTLAGRIDRLARRAHAFHRYAHHPLCNQYAAELISLRGRARVCRGCSYALTGAIAGSMVGLIDSLPSAGSAVGAAGWIVAVELTRRASAQPSRDVRLGLHHVKLRRARASKFWTRGAPAFACSAALCACIRVHDVVSLAALALLVATLAWALRRYRVRGPNRQACVACPEARASVPCSGYREIVRAERAFRRRAQRLIDSHASQVSVSS